MLWAERYKPKFEELGVHDTSKQELKDFIINFSKKNKKALMIYGPSGTGKTLAIYSLAKKLNYEIIELNASDLRDRAQLERIAGCAMMQKSLFSKGKIILIDEIEGLNRKDRGAITELTRIIDNRTCPIVFTVNDAWQEKIRKLRSKCYLIKFQDLDKEAIMKILTNISKKEKLKISKQILQLLAGQSQGDARAAINDLQSIAMACKGEICKEDISSLGFREKDENIFQALKIIFKSKSALGVFDNVQLDLDTLMLWLDENIPREYKGESLKRAYETLSLADVFRGRIIRRQHWRFLSYVYSFISQGIAVAKDKENNDFVSYKPPQRILKLWIYKQKLLRKRSISEKIAKKTHISKKKAERDFIFMQLIISSKEAAQELKLEQNELEFLRNQ
jgi:replication factor C large subunit